MTVIIDLVYSDNAAVLGDTIHGAPVFSRVRPVCLQTKFKVETLDVLTALLTRIQDDWFGYRDDGDSKLLRNGGTNIIIYTAPHHTRPDFPS